MEVVWATAFAKRYDIRASVDGHTWRTIVDSAIGLEGPVLHRFERAERAKLIRLLCQEPPSSGGCSMFELKAKGQLQQGCRRVALDPEVTRAMHHSKITELS